MATRNKNPRAGVVGLLRYGKHTTKAALRVIRQRRVTGPQIAADVAALGVRPGGILLVHSSLSALGYVPGAARTVIDALRQAVGPDGTLVMPTHSWSQMAKGCRTFDVRRTSSCVGQITEQFRQMPSVIRSRHPTHSVAACGPLAEDLAANHDRSDTPCGHGTPYERIMELDGQVLLLGVGTIANTCFHATEAIAGVAYLLQEASDTFDIIDESGCSRTISVRRHQPHVRRRFPEMEEILVREGIAKRGMVGNSESLLAQGRVMRDFLLRKLREDPTFLLARNGP